MLFRSQFRRRADPGRADHEQDLSENEIEQPKGLFERYALAFDVVLFAIQFRRHGRALFRCCFGRRRVAKFPVANFSAGIGNVSARA